MPVPSITKTGQGKPPAEVTPQITQQMSEADTNPPGGLPDIRAVGRDRPALERDGVLGRRGPARGEPGDRDQVGHERGELGKRTSTQDGLAALVELLAVDPPVGVCATQDAVDDITIRVRGPQRTVLGAARVELELVPGRRRRHTGILGARMTPTHGHAPGHLRTDQALSTAPHFSSAAASAF
jgi:hypothetical protein